MTAKSEHNFPNIGTLVNRLIQAAQAEQELLLQLGEAVGRDDREAVFRIAAELTGRAASTPAIVGEHNSPPK